jgi:hypothetical protein
VTDWRTLLDTSELTLDDVKERLPLEWVILEAGVVLERREDGRLVGICPFHLDSNPSFAVFGEDLQRCGCWSCDFSNGDVFDFIGRWKALDFRASLKEAIALLRRYEATASSWTPAPAPTRQVVDPEVLAAKARAAYQLAGSDLRVLGGFLVAKGIPVPAQFLHESWWVGALDSETILVPHLVDREDRLQVTAYKTRTARTHLYSAAGSRFEDLYGAWRDQGREEIILCEGESDAWLLSYLFPDSDVVALPAGANQPPKPEWVDRFRHREVVILTDADGPGRAAAKRWHEALVPLARSVRIAALEDGADACSTQLDLSRVVRDAVEVPLWTGQVRVSPEGTHYVRTNTGQPVNNWAIRPTRLVAMDEGGSAIEGVLQGTRETVVITGDDMSMESAARRWSLRHDRVWLGTTKDAQALWEYLLREGPFLARGEGTTVAGWHDGHFVLPGRTTGPRHWVYVPPVTEPDVPRLVGALNGPIETGRRALLAGLSLHQPAVVSPIAAWLASAPLRALFRTFPPLAVVGGAGSGKTTLVAEMLRIFGWSGLEHNITSTTPYGVAAMVSATNGVPVWFDEYRRGARRDTKEAFDQALRDAWTASAAVRGGTKSNASSLATFRVSAPLIVSGEDAFSETSHGERLVIVTVNRGGRSVDALEYLRRHPASVGDAYAHWLVEGWHAGTLPRVQTPDADRPSQARYALEFGWALLERFAGEVLNAELPDLDLTRVEQERDEVLAVPPILDAVAWALFEVDRRGNPLAWVQENDVIVRVRSLVAESRREALVELPGGERATTSWLREEFPSRRERTPYGLALRLVGVRKLIEAIGTEPAEPTE